MRSRSRPQRPRTGSPNAVRSAGTGQRRSTKCRRGGPVAAQRSSGLPRRQDREPHRGGRARRPSGRKGGAQPGPDGRWHPRGRAGENGAAGGAPSRQGATPRRDPGDCNAGRLPNRSVKRAHCTRRTGMLRTCGMERRHRARISKGGAGPGAEERDGDALARVRKERCRRRDRAGAEECPGAPPAYLLMGWRAGIPPPGETGGRGKSCKGRDGHPSGRRGPCLPLLSICGGGITC